MRGRDRLGDDRFVRPGKLSCRGHQERLPRALRLPAGWLARLPLVQSPLVQSPLVRLPPLRGLARFRDWRDREWLGQATTESSLARPPQRGCQSRRVGR